MSDQTIHHDQDKTPAAEPTPTPDELEQRRKQYLDSRGHLDELARQERQRRQQRRRRQQR